MSKFVSLKNGTILTLALRPFASGGEGDIYKITNPTSFQNHVVKIYKQEKRTKQRESKIDFLAKNPPPIQIQDGHNSVIWINQLAYENGMFCGFIMPMANGEKLELLCHPKLSPTLNSEWSKFDFQNQNAIELRLKLCFNIAVALNQIHRLNNYVLVDMKPENIIVQPNGLISIIDTDSVAVVKNKKTIFPAPVATPEYTPPEYYKELKLDYDGVSDSWDRFSLAVIFYRLLCGIHPFTGSCNGQFEKCHGLVDMVRNGLFPNGIRGLHFKIIPPPHNNFKKLVPTVQGLFKRCFDDGYTNPDIRPNPDEWCRCLSPQQMIQINRRLPSNDCSFPSYNYSKPIDYNPSTSVEKPIVRYSNLTQTKGLKAVFYEIFGKSKQQRFVEFVIQKETELRAKEQIINHFSSDLRSILKQFTKDQEKILVGEYSKISELKSEFMAELANTDKIAIDLHLKEVNEIKSASYKFTSTIAQVDELIKLAYSNILAKRYEIHEAKMISFQNNVINLRSQELAELNTLLNNPTKLLKYKIEYETIPNFGSSTKKALADVGIITAADFIDISAEGYFKNRSGKWVKANGVGWGRAYDLREWQRQSELKENQIISETVKQNYLYKYSKINIDIKELVRAFEIEIEPFHAQFNREKVLNEGTRVKETKIYHDELNQIKSKFDKLHIELITNTKNYTASYIVKKLNDISFETKKILNSNFIHYFSLFESKIKEINAYTENFKNDINNLIQLHNQLLTQTVTK